MNLLKERLSEVRRRLAPIHSQYRVAFEDPAFPDAPACVLVPDPNWMAAAMAGNILPPVEVYHAMIVKLRTRFADGRTYQHVARGEHLPDLRVEAMHEAAAARQDPPFFDEEIVWHALHDAPVMPALSEEQAIGYLIMKDIPPRVWRGRGNSRRLAITTLDRLPAVDRWRDAWKLDQGESA